MALITGTSDVAVNMQSFYDRNLLERAVPALIHGKFAQMRPLPKNKGTRINFRRYGAFAANTTPLTEGVTPTGKKLTTTDIYATIRFYGDFITLTDVLTMTGLDNSLIEGGEVLSDQMGLTADTLDRDVLVAGTSLRYAGGTVTTRLTVAAAVAVADLKAAVRILEGGNAKKITRQVVAGQRIGTRPIAPAYYAIAHTDLRQDLEALAGFTKVEEYANQKGVPDEEIGSWGNIRFLLSTNAKVWLAGGMTIGAGLVSSDGVRNDVYAIIIQAANAFGSIPLQKGNVKNIIKKMGSAGTEDPLDQRASSGWKIAKTGKILNDDFMVRIEVGATDI